MSPMALVFTVVALVMAKQLVTIYLGGAYVCPSCGARRQDRHTDDCPWKPSR